MAEQTQKKKGWKFLVVLVLAAAIAVAVFVMTANGRNYKKANAALARGEYAVAEELFEKLGDYEDSRQLLLKSRYGVAESYYLSQRYDVALRLFFQLGTYGDSLEKCQACYYAMAAEALDRYDYDDAIEYYAAAGEYADSAQRLLATYYAKGEEALDSWDFELARECFAQAGSWADSPRMILKTYYVQGELLLSWGDYLAASEAFLMAGDYEDAPARANETIYELAHTLFMDGKFDEAQPYFDMLQGYPENGGPHFVRLEDARSYFMEQTAALNPSYVCYLYEAPKASYSELREMMQNYSSYQKSSIIYSDYKKMLTVQLDYYPGDRILYAWRTGDDSILSADERKAKEVAEGIVKKARNTKNDMEAQLYLYNWLCNNVMYETTNMQVGREAYLKLRQITCIGALLDGKANCQGYTDAFYLLGNMAGFNVCRMFGRDEKEGHCWNGIMLDGKLYIVDVTFGDWDNIGTKAKGYIQFNCAYDPETYIIDGGPEVFPELVTTEDLSQTYYKYKKSIFTSKSDAVNYLVRQCKKNGKGWYFAVVDDKILSSSQVISALKSARTKNGVYNGCNIVVQTYGGDTHIAVRWK